MARGTATAVALVASCFLAGGIMFVPGFFPSTASLNSSSAVGRQAEASRPSEDATTASSLQGLLGGLVLGLVLSAATASPVLAEDAAPAPKQLSDEEILAKGCDIRVDCKTKEQQFAYAKAYYRKYNRESDGKDPKYSASSTGGGIYRKYKIDQYINKLTDEQMPADGTYKIRPDAVAFQPIWEKYNKDLVERVEKVYGISDEPIRWNGDYYDNKLSPYKPALGWYNK
ncbi:CATSPER1 [Symbiodinium pilosum]|uniref:CATSPER1 protein n=1 Tax=Symbiodinium pilosum TaxID=2952 RepID=A0A812SJ89_SYMPI|nr:CATSPER1 [Symbiodinium pilosum]